MIRSEVKEASFGFYSDEELKRLSVAKITSPVTRDTLGNTLSGYVWDQETSFIVRVLLFILQMIHFSQSSLTSSLSILLVVSMIHEWVLLTGEFYVLHVD